MAVRWSTDVLSVLDIYISKHRNCKCIYDWYLLYGVNSAEYFIAGREPRPEGERRKYGVMRRKSIKWIKCTLLVSHVVSCIFYSRFTVIHAFVTAKPKRILCRTVVVLVDDNLHAVLLLQVYYGNLDATSRTLTDNCYKKWLTWKLVRVAKSLCGIQR